MVEWGGGLPGCEALVSSWLVARALRWLLSFPADVNAKCGLDAMTLKHAGIFSCLYSLHFS